MVRNKDGQLVPDPNFLARQQIERARKQRNAKSSKENTPKPKSSPRKKGIADQEFVSSAMFINVKRKIDEEESKNGEKPAKKQRKMTDILHPSEISYKPSNLAMSNDSGVAPKQISNPLEGLPNLPNLPGVPKFDQFLREKMMEKGVLPIPQAAPKSSAKKSPAELLKFNKTTMMVKKNFPSLDKNPGHLMNPNPNSTFQQKKAQGEKKIL